MIQKENAQDRGLGFKQEEAPGPESRLLKEVLHIMSVLTFKRVSVSLCVVFLKGSTMVGKNSN